MALFELLGHLSRQRRVALTPALVIFLALCLVSSAPADPLVFTQPQMLPGDAVIGTSAGMQVEADIARGGTQFLAVWNDGRSTPDDYWPFATEGSGTDIYGVRLDAAGNLIDVAPFVINQALGDQVEPHVAWNGAYWLVVWKQDTVTLPTYEELLAVRVAPDGTVVDATPIVVHSNQSRYDWDDAAIEGGNGEWVVVFEANGPVVGLQAVRIAGDGTVVNPGGALIHGTNFGVEFDIAFAQDEYMIVLGGPFDAPRARRYNLNLQLLGTSPLPFAEKIASDGTDFLVVAANGSAPLATVDAVFVTHDGVVLSPFTLYAPGGQAGTCCAGVTWDGTLYWASWGGPRLARITPAGDVLDPGGFPLIPAEGKILFTRYEALVGGGLQLVYNHSSRGADDPKDIYTAQVSPAGEFGNVTLASSGAPAQLEADFAEGDGTHLIVFISRVSDSGRILAQRIDATGTAIDVEPIEVATGPLPGPDFGPPLLGAPAAAWNGSVFMITWSDGLEIFARRMLPDGSFLDATPLTIMDGHSPDVAAVGEVFLVVGLDYLLDVFHWQAVHSMRVDGTTGANLDPVSNALGDWSVYARYPHVVRWDDRWLVVFQQNISHDNTIAGTTAAIVDADGTTPGLIDVPLGWRPDVAVSDDRALFVAVTGTVATAENNIAGVIMLADGTFPDPWFPISEAPYKQLRPAVSWNGSDFIVAWEDKRNAVIYFDQRTDIYGSRVSANGTVLDPDAVPLAAAPVPEIKPALLSIGSSTLLAVSTFKPETELGAYRITTQLDVNTPTGIPDAPSTESGIRLLGARPNPANPSTTIRFEYDERLPVTLRVFDARGRLVRTLLEGQVFDASAPIDVWWDGRDNAGRRVASGVFFYEIRTPTEAVSGRVVMLK